MVRGNHNILDKYIKLDKVLSGSALGSEVVARGDYSPRVHATITRENLAKQHEKAEHATLRGTHYCPQGVRRTPLSCHEGNVFSTQERGGFQSALHTTVCMRSHIGNNTLVCGNDNDFCLEYY